MTPNEYMMASYKCEVYEDIYKNGEGDFCQSFSGSVGNEDHRYFSVKEVLNAVKDELYAFSAIEDWCDWYAETGEDIGRFDTDILVTNDNYPADDIDISKWKRGEMKLYNMHVMVLVEVAALNRELTEEELKTKGE